MKTLKQFQPKLLAAAVLIGLCTVSGSAFAAPGDGAGGGSGGGGAGTGEIFGDLVVLLRDESGVPKLTPEGCQQPINAAGDLILLDTSTCAVQVGHEAEVQSVDFGCMSVARSPASVMDKQMADVLVN